MTTECYFCDCGAYHPIGVTCEKRKEAAACKTHTHDHAHDHGHGHIHGDSCCGHDDHSREHGHDHCSCCSHEHAESVGLTNIGEASATRAIYRIVNMDCPMEEMLIRKRLGSVSGIGELKFDLMQRVLTVDHNLPSTTPIEEALRSIDMTPESLNRNQGSVATFTISEMDCPTEEELIRTKLKSIPGILGLEFNLMQRTLKVRHDDSALPSISEALYTLNLGAKLIESNADNSSSISAPKIPWRRLAVAGIFAALSEVIELICEWGAFGSTPIIEQLPMAFAVFAILLAGFTTYKKGWIAVKNFNLNMNALMSVAVTGAVLIRQYPEAAMVMVLFNIAEAIEAKALDRARNAIRNLLSLTPEKATVQNSNGSWVEMDIRQIAIGSRVRVRPGERVALDGLIVQGQSAINQAPITGESLPIEKIAGDNVFAGTINESGSFEFQVTAAANNSTLARIIHAVEEAQGSRAPIQRFVDQFSRIYTPAVFLASLLVGIVPPLFMGGAWADWVYTALVILVIGCPCALVISTPVSIVSGMAAATRYGILVKGGMFLEQGRLLKYLALDKTGTLTKGKPSQTDLVLTDQLGETDAATLAASIASRSDHPVSRAIAESAAEKNVLLREVADFAAIPGQGVSGVIDGMKWHLGNLRMVEDLEKCSDKLEQSIFELEKEGKSVVALINNEGVQALFAVADTLRENSIAAIRELKKFDIKTIMLTGDNEHTAEAIAKQVGVDSFQGNLLPEDKLRVVEKLAKSGKVGMVGDGINDAPALAKADIGFAMAAAGTDTAIETADVALMDDDLRKIPRFIALSRSTYAILMQNITLALGVKAAFFALAFMGFATMWMAVIADVGTSLLVVANGLRAMQK